MVENTAFTDSIFAVILKIRLTRRCNYYSLLGSIPWRGLRISMNAPDKQGRLLAAGITVWLTSQTLLNIAANVGLVPLTGMPIPFLTYGGSSTIVTLIGIAILLNVSRFTKTNAQ